MTQEQLDLIERYLDGKASPSEASELLESMKQDPSLSTDMEAVSTLHAAVDEDLAAITLPDSLYGSIVEEAVSAGTLGAAGGTTAVTWITANGSTLLSLVLAVSLVATVGIWTAVNSSMSEPATHAAVAPPVPPSDVPQTTPDLASGSDPSAPTTSAALTVASDDGSIESVSPATVRSADSRPQQPITSDRQRREASTPIADPPRERGQRPIAINTMSVASAPELPITAPMELASDDLEENATLSWPHSSYSDPQALPPITVRVLQRPVSGFSYQTTSTESALTSLGLEAEIPVATNHAVGLGLHHDLFPVQLDNGDGTTTTAPYMTWVGAHYRWMPDVKLPLSARPFLHLGAGGSSRGIAVQPALGVMIPVSTLQLGIGADVVGLAFQNQGTWSTAFSPALRIELGYSW